LLFNTLVELQPKDAGGEEGVEQKSPADMVGDFCSTPSSPPASFG
jgi:hypothetical protein